MNSRKKEEYDPILLKTKQFELVWVVLLTQNVLKHYFHIFTYKCKLLTKLIFLNLYICHPFLKECFNPLYWCRGKAI